MNVGSPSESAEDSTALVRSSAARLGLKISRLTALLARLMQSATYRLRDKFDPIRKTSLVAKAGSDGRRNGHEREGSLDVVITTFDERLTTCCLDLVRTLALNCLVREVIVIVNGVYGSKDVAPSHVDRKYFRAQIGEFSNVRLVELGRYRGLSYMWNLGLALTDTKLKWVTNDDVLLSAGYGTALGEMCELADDTGLCLGNGFSSFVIGDRCLQEVGWFDERFVGIGSEDGDYLERYVSKFGGYPPRVQSHYFLNMSSGQDPRKSGASSSIYAAANRSLLERSRSRRESSAVTDDERSFLHGRQGYWFNRAFGERGVSCAMSEFELKCVDRLDTASIWRLSEQSKLTDP